MNCMYNQVQSGTYIILHGKIKKYLKHVRMCLKTPNQRGQKFTIWRIHGGKVMYKRRNSSCLMFQCRGRRPFFGILQFHNSLWKIIWYGYLHIFFPSVILKLKTWNGSFTTKVTTYVRQDEYTRILTSFPRHYLIFQIKFSHISVSRSISHPYNNSHYLIMK